jgi:hypothetical protein
MVAIFIIAVVAAALFLTFVLPEIRASLRGIKGRGLTTCDNRGESIVGGIRVNGRPMSY